MRSRYQHGGPVDDEPDRTSYDNKGYNPMEWSPPRPREPTPGPDDTPPMARRPTTEPMLSPAALARSHDPREEPVGTGPFSQKMGAAGVREGEIDDRRAEPRASTGEVLINEIEAQTAGRKYDREARNVKPSGNYASQQFEDIEALPRHWRATEAAHGEVHSNVPRRRKK